MIETNKLIHVSSIVNALKDEKINPFKNSGKVHGNNSEYYEYISAGTEGERCIREAINIFSKTHKRKPKTFLDLGSGRGGMLFVASKLGMQATGVELSETLIEQFNDIRKHPKLPRTCKKVNAVQGNILEWVPDQEYDIVYFFQPIRDIDLWKCFLKRFVQIFPEGQLVASFYGMYKTPGLRPVIQTDQSAWVLDHTFLPTVRESDYSNPYTVMGLAPFRVDRLESGNMVAAVKENDVVKMYKTTTPPVFNFDSFQLEGDWVMLS